MKRSVTFYHGYGHYEVYAEPAFSLVMRATLDWYRHHVPAR